MEYQKDYSLLRQFDLEAAKRGEKIITQYGDERIYIDGPDYIDNICVKGSKGGLYLVGDLDLRMSPLAWVEGRPVYKGDVLYWKPENRKVTVSGSDNADWMQGTDEANYMIKNLTWQKPKTKREGWVNIVKEECSGACGEIKDRLIRNCDIFPSYEKAKSWADECGDVIVTVKITWEE